MAGCVLRLNCSLSSYRCLPNIRLWQNALSLPTPPKHSSTSALSLSSSRWHHALAMRLASMSLAPPPDLSALRTVHLLICDLPSVCTQGTARLCTSLQTKSVNLNQINHKVLSFILLVIQGQSFTTFLKILLYKADIYC